MLSSQQSLIIFTRYPEIGTTKTRLIPAIGAEKASNLQKKMTQLTIDKSRQLQDKLNLNIDVYFSGGNKEKMASWLGENINFKTQAQGDLGTKMYSALEDKFKQGSKNNLIIGTDCPDLTTDILFTAFNQLKNHDLVIGEAEDGGYYLIGLNSLIPDLFIDINWGTETVFSQTIDKAKKLNLSVYQLPILRDLDRPEDLEFYQFLI